jgi:hypothetical protein
MTKMVAGFLGRPANARAQHIIKAAWKEVRHVTGCNHINVDFVQDSHPLVMAAANGHADICKLLYQQGVYWRTLCKAFREAAAAGHLAVVEWVVYEVPRKVEQAQSEAVGPDFVQQVVQVSGS